jgi:hypothetical protein
MFAEGVTDVPRNGKEKSELNQVDSQRTGGPDRVTMLRMGHPREKREKGKRSQVKREEDETIRGGQNAMQKGWGMACLSPTHTNAWSADTDQPLFISYRANLCLQECIEAASQARVPLPSGRPGADGACALVPLKLVV